MPGMSTTTPFPHSTAHFSPPPGRYNAFLTLLWLRHTHALGLPPSPPLAPPHSAARGSARGAWQARRAQQPHRRRGSGSRCGWPLPGPAVPPAGRRAVGAHLWRRAPAQRAAGAESVDRGLTHRGGAAGPICRR
eukprot:354892-Chlamydomonas_euryale.AAC.4